MNSTNRNVQVININTSEVITSYRHKTRISTFPVSYSHIVSPVYPVGNGFYIWYKHSIPETTDVHLISDEHKLLFSSKENKYTGIIPKASILIRVYLFGVIAAIIILLSVPILNVLKADNMIGNDPEKGSEFRRSNIQLKPIVPL